MSRLQSSSSYIIRTSQLLPHHHLYYLVMHLPSVWNHRHHLFLLLLLWEGDQFQWIWLTLGSLTSMFQSYSLWKISSKCWGFNGLDSMPLGTGSFPFSFVWEEGVTVVLISKDGKLISISVRKTEVLGEREGGFRFETNFVVEIDRQFPWRLS